VANQSEKSREEGRREIISGAQLSSHYLVMNGLATVVAGYGLLANSTAVVIGAMIIAMLLGPIMGLALAIVDGDTRLLRQALVAEIVGGILVFVLGACLGRLHSDLPLTAEILARTKPNLLDLMIAVFGGAAGAYATVSPKLSVGLVGVAISTALVPPLAASGICLSRGHFDLATGAFILFLTNLVAIQCASSVVLFAFGYHDLTHREPGDKSYMRRLIVDAALFLVLGVFLYFQLAKTSQRNQFEEVVKDQLEVGLKIIPGAYLSDTRFRSTSDAEIVVAVVTVPNSITPLQTAALEGELTKVLKRHIELHIRSLLTKETTAKGYLHEIQPQAPPIENVIENTNSNHTDPPPVVDSSSKPLLPELGGQNAE
jgi:uncharacterized hydrophobic protein (TIGR00271 family)